MARFSLLVASMLALAAMAGSIHLKHNDERQVEVDLHALCEELARRCWDLDPADFGMTPVNGMVLPPGGTLAGTEWDEGVNFAERLLGERVHVHGHANGSAALTMSGDEEMAGQVPCADAPDCPDLLVDPQSFSRTITLDERTFAPTSCAVAENATQAGARRLLRFTFTSPNLGAGDLEIGNPNDHTEWFQWGTCHNHWHFREYADYRLWTVPGYAAWQAIRAAHPTIPPGEVLEAYPELRDMFVAGHKQGFCVIDLVSYLGNFVRTAQFRDCATNQGITQYWGDEYHLFLDGQWVDVTDVEPGAYVLEAEVNPERFYVESDYTNNAAAMVVQLLPDV